MNDLSKLLQGRLQNRKVHIKDPNSRQLDLFSSLSDRGTKVPEKSTSAAEPSPVNPPEPELVLPPPGSPPDVSADVRAVLSESGQVQRIDVSEPGDGESTLRTGIYHRHRRPVAPPPPPPPPRSGPRRGLSLTHLRQWLAGVEMDRRHVALVVILIVLVALIAYWSARPRPSASAPGTTVDLGEVLPDAPPAASGPAVPAAAVPAVPAPALPPASPAPSVLAAGWKIPGTVATPNGGAVLIRFTDPVFVSADRISVEGMRALKAVAARLVEAQTGARVTVTGHTDNVPLNSPTSPFKNNADLAAARARVVVEHLAQFSRANKGLVYEARAGAVAEAPYPNDTAPNRKLNRTVTLQVIPAGNEPGL